MCQLKPFFNLSEQKLSETVISRRMANYQKCIRIGGKQCDLEKIGKSSSHLTLFEMLGCWSFGSYNMNDAIGMIIDFLTNELDFKKNQFKITYFGGNPNDKNLNGIPPENDVLDSWKSFG